MSKPLLQKLYFGVRSKVYGILHSFRPRLSVVVLSWNRFFLLRQTLYSLLANSSLVNEIIIVDNNSQPEVRTWLKEFASTRSKVQLILLDENEGGNAINRGLVRAKGQFILISENDLEFKPEWDSRMIAYFDHHPKLGQLSPFSAFPEESKGEVWSIKKFIKKQINDMEFHIAEQNVTTSCMLRRQIVEIGVRIGTLTSPGSDVRFPSDAQLSNDVKAAGYDVAWSTQYLAANWGHNESMWRAFPEYFSKNFSSKQFHGMDGLSSDAVSMDTLKQKNESLLKKLKYIKEMGIVPASTWEQLNIYDDTSLFLDLGQGFQESTKLTTELKVKNNHVKITFDVSERAKIYNFRWDPKEGSGCLVRNLQIQVTDINDNEISVSNWQCNGITLDKQQIKFETPDPFITFENKIPSPKSIQISCEFGH